MPPLTIRLLSLLSPSKPRHPSELRAAHTKRYKSTVPLGSLYTTMQRLHRRGLTKSHGLARHLRYTITPAGRRWRNLSRLKPSRK